MRHISSCPVQQASWSHSCQRCCAIQTLAYAPAAATCWATSVGTGDLVASGQWHGRAFREHGKACLQRCCATRWTVAALYVGGALLTPAVQSPVLRRFGATWGGGGAHRAVQGSGPSGAEVRMLCNRQCRRAQVAKKDFPVSLCPSLHTADARDCAGHWCASNLTGSSNISGWSCTPCRLPQLQPVPSAAPCRAAVGVAAA